MQPHFDICLLFSSLWIPQRIILPKLTSFDSSIGHLENYYFICARPLIQEKLGFFNQWPVFDAPCILKRSFTILVDLISFSLRRREMLILFFQPKRSGTWEILPLFFQMFHVIFSTLSHNYFRQNGPVLELSQGYSCSQICFSSYLGRCILIVLWKRTVFYCLLVDKGNGFT